ncbi:hypothetical protein LUZ62_034861 [Rhynchospora pubera]|uniref:Uncharacterized protein n=1 Tax=Rhynchospora pubera TaxID=906938 RepID=A0AAV8E8C0_9POAL|nr:hypothetical protein LUZ62_061076 [Rhynchospora pubera]KAJ4783615.1 hypothetical protein LUZ62_034861 [Rhynchospora pubera]
MAPTVKDVLTFHKIDRAVYEKFLAYGMVHDKARKAVALFLWLEQLGIDMTTPIHNIINNVSKISTLITEIDAVLCCLQQNDHEHSYYEIPLITSLAKNSIDIHFFNLHKDSIVRGLVFVIDGIGRHVFDGYEYGLLRSYESEVAAAARRSSAVRPQVPPALAKLCTPAGCVLSSEQKRSMYITMRRGVLIGRDEIIQHFTA